MEQNKRSSSPEKVCGACGKDGHISPYYQNGDVGTMVQVNAAGNWNQSGNWIQGNKRDAPWRDHANFRWSEPNQNNQGPQPNPLNHPPQHNQPPPNSNPSSSYVPPHQRGYQHNQVPHNNYQPNQGPHHNTHHQVQNPNQSTHYQNYQNQSGNQSRPPRSLEDMMGDLINSQQHLQNNVQSNNDVVHRMQDAQKEQKASLDMLTRQMSQLATSMNEMHGNEGKISASVKQPDMANVSQITLRYGKALDGAMMKMVVGESSGKSGTVTNCPDGKVVLMARTRIMSKS